MNKHVSIILNGKDNATQAFRKVGASSGRLQKQISGLKVAFGGLFAGIGAVSLAKWSISSVSALEQVQTSFETMLGSVEKSQKLMGQLRTFAATTPFEMEGITDATKKLLAFGFAQEDVIPQLRRLGDIGSAIGVPLSEIAEIYGKARVQGRLFAEDVNQLTGRGIPVIQEFAKQFGVTDSEVRKLVESGKIGFKELEKAIINMTKAGSMFGGGMEKQSKTLAGQWSTLKDQIKEINNDLATGMLPTLKKLVEGSAELAKNFSDWMLGPEKRKGLPVQDQYTAITREITALEEKRKRSVHIKEGSLAERIFGPDAMGVRLKELRAEEARLRQQVQDNERKERAAVKDADFDKRFGIFRERMREWNANNSPTNKAIRESISDFTADGIVDGVKRAARAIGGLQDRGGELLNDLDRKAFQFNARREERLALKDQVKEQRREMFADSSLSAVESRFLTRGAGRIDPALVEAKKSNQLAEKNLKELREQNRHLRQLAGKRGLQPANLN